MITTQNISLRYGKRVIFEDVDIRFTKGNCYGIIGANGAGKTTFLKILAGEIDPLTGNVEITPGMRMAVLKQNHFAYDDWQVLNTVIAGHQKLWDIMQEKDAIYAKPDFSDEDGIRASELETEFAEMNGWNAESDAAALLSNLGIHESLHHKLMKDINAAEKVRVLLAQALFGMPDILMLDEPTNDLDAASIAWLENYLADYPNIIIVVSHDRHFLDAICTHVADIDFGKITLFTGNYSFWYESSQLALKQRADKNKKTEDKRKELLDFIARFSANASKARQATSRKKALEKLNLEDIKPSNRRYPGITFQQSREAGNQILEINQLGKQNSEGEWLFRQVSLTVNKGDKIAVLADNHLAVTAFFNILAGASQADEGQIEWGVTINPSYLPNDNSAFFTQDANLMDWLRDYSTDKDEVFIRSFLGRMLFSGEETLKKVSVLSGGEKMRCMIARLMLQTPNLLLLDEPTNHLDMETIISLNNALVDYKGTVLFSSHDHQLTQTVANRILKLTSEGAIDKLMTYDEYLASVEMVV